MLKPSEMTPRTSELLASAVAEFFDSDEICVIQGGVDVATAFSQLPFDHLVFTGSSRTGRLVMKAAAENLVPVTLEMGGKSPVLIGRSADLRMAAHRIVLGKTLNAGQVCVTPDTVYVPQESLEAFLQECVTQYQAMFPHGRHDEGWTAIINGHHAQRLEGYLDELRSRSARCIPCMPGEPAGAAKKMALWLAVQPPSDSRLANEEIFGPALEVQTYQTINEAVDQINTGESPLALYYFGADPQEEQFVLDHTRSGGVTVNDVMLHVAAHDAPFGGVGASGMGCYHGHEGFLQFSHARTVYRSGWWDPRRALGLIPPYGSKTYANLRRTLRP
jgi:coniferyl-aldehyde dehydrogenase